MLNISPGSAVIPCARDDFTHDREFVQSDGLKELQKPRYYNVPCCAALINCRFLGLIGGKRSYTIISHIVQNAANVRRNIDRRFFRLSDERMFQQFIVLGSLSFLFN